MSSNKMCMTCRYFTTPPWCVLDDKETEPTYVCKGYDEKEGEEAPMNLKVTRDLGDVYIVSSDCGRVVSRVMWSGVRKIEGAEEVGDGEVVGKGAHEFKRLILKCVYDWRKEREQPFEDKPVLKVRRDLDNTNMFHVTGDGIESQVEVVAGRSKDFVRVTGKGANTHKPEIIDAVIHYMSAADGVLPDDARAVAWEARKAVVEELKSLQEYETTNVFVALTVCHKIEMLEQQIQELDDKLSAPRLDFYKGSIEVKAVEQYRVFYKFDGMENTVLSTDSCADLDYAKARRNSIALDKEVSEAVVVNEMIQRRIVDWDREVKHEELA